ncbi:MAG: 50S ribosomal protein L3 [Alphaproteobacteria bacterium]|nr:50S ribosomal protein L3 [Alphaproteobacteria bacterium]
MRTGVIAKKVGMMGLFQENGDRLPVTVLEIDSTVIDTRTKEKDGYTAVQLGSGKIKEKNIAKPQKGHFAKLKQEPKKTLVEFRVSEDCLIPAGSVIGANHFVVGQLVDVVGTSLGKGYAGVMKRYNFHGDNATHGVSRTHRSGGSTGNREWPGRVVKNTEMPGQLGNERVTVQNLEVVAIDEGRNLIMVKGGVPGFDNAVVLVSDAKKRSKQAVGPVPAGLKAEIKAEPAKEAVKEEAAPKAEEVPAEVKAEEVKE